MGSLLQDVIGLFAKKKYAPNPYDLNTDGKEDFLILSTKQESGLNVMAYLPKLEQELISVKQLADAINVGANTTYDYTSAQDAGNVNLVLTGSDATIDIVKLIAGTNITLTDDGSNNVTIDSADQFVGTVTSVGLTMPAAFTVANSPITTSGTLAVTGAGTNVQVILGDGSLGDYTTGTMSGWRINDGTFTGTVTDNEAVQFLGDTVKIATTLTLAGGNPEKLTITHIDTTRVDTTSVASPAFGTSFTVVDTITQDATGHPTAVNVKTVTLPTPAAASNTTYVLGGAVSNVDDYSVSLTGSDGSLTKTIIEAGTSITLTDLGTPGVKIDAINTVVNSGNGINITGTTISPIVNIDYAGVDNAILVAPTEVITNQDYLWFSDVTDDSIKKVLVSDLPGGSGAVTQIVGGTNVTVSPANGTGVVTVNSTDQFSGTVTSVATSNGTFVNVSGGTITTSGTITAELSAAGTPSSSTYLRGDNSWAAIPTDTNTTYDLVSAQNGSDADIKLDGSNGTIDTVKLIAGTNITLTDTGNNITIDSTNTGGTVTSVAATTGGDALDVGGSPITSSGTLAFTWAGQITDYINGQGNLITFPTIPAAYGGWLLGGDLGASESVEDGNTATVAGGVGITTSVTAPDTLTVDLDNTGVTAAAYTSADITVNAQGQITAAANGSPAGALQAGVGLEIDTSTSPDTIQVDYIGAVNVVTDSPACGAGLPCPDITVDSLLFHSSKTPGAYHCLMQDMFDDWKTGNAIAEVFFSVNQTGKINNGRGGLLGAVTATSSATGLYDIVFTAAQPSINYMINLTTEAASGGFNTFITNKTTTSFTIAVEDTSSNPINTLVNVVIYATSS